MQAHLSNGSASLLVAQGLAWRTPRNDLIFRNLNLSIGRERVGLVGPNGVGKTTLLRLLAGELAPSAGSIGRNGSVELLPQTIDAVAGQTVAGALRIADKLDALDRLTRGVGNEHDLRALDDDWTVSERARAQLDAVGLPQVTLHARMSNLSGGEITRVLLAGMLLRVPDALLLDEPTNNLDRPARDALYRVVETWKSGLLVVTHDRELLGRVDRIVELSAGRGAISYGGNWTYYEQQKQLERQAAQSDFDNAAKELKLARRNAQALKERQERRTSDGARRAKRQGIPAIILGGMKRHAQQTAGKLADRQAELTEAATTRKRAAQERLDERPTLDIELSPVEVPAGKLVVRLQDVSFKYPETERWLVERMSFELLGPRRVAVVGPNGSGKTTLLRLIAGELEPTSGRVHRGVKRWAYLDQHASLLARGKTILENFRIANPKLSETTCRKTLARFLFRADDVHRTPDTLSGGQRLRAALAVTLSAVDPPQLLLLDEPTNHLDLESLANVEAALSSFGGAMMVVSHDATFLEHVRVDNMTVEM
jgi:ATPase subunit of ABC transporter with duplicated ATPase domains